MTLSSEDKRRVFRELKTEFANERRAKRKASKKAGTKARSLNPFKGQRTPRVEDPTFLAWIRGLKCIGCVQDQTPSRSMRSEAAHVRFADASAGWSHTGKGEKPHDRRTLPLCHGHHRDGPKAQHASGERAWWEARGIYPPALCNALEAAYEAGEDGNAVIRRFALATDLQAATQPDTSREATKRVAQGRPNTKDPSL